MIPLLTTAAGHSAASLAMFFQPSTSLAHLSTIDVLVIAIYFAMVLWIGFYLKQQANTSEEFFMAGREMTAWIAGLSFVSANLGSLELMGWAGSAYQYGILAAHWYWIGAIPAMLFLGLVMMPFYYVSKTHSVPGYLKLRFGESSRVLAAVSFGFMTILMSGVNMFAMAVVMKVVLGWDITFSILVSSLAVALYVTLGGLRSAIFNEVLQFVLIWAGALLVPILGMIQAGGWHNLQTKILLNYHNQDYTHMWRGMGHFADNPMGIHWTGIVFGLGFVIAFGYWTTDFLVVQRVLAANSLRSAQMAPIIASVFKMAVPFIVILPGLLGLVLLTNPDGSIMHLVGENAMAPGLHSYNEVLPLLDGALLRAGTSRAGNYRSHCRLYVRHGRQCQRLLSGVDLRHLSAAYQEERDGQASGRGRPLGNDSWRACVDRHGIPGDACAGHHGLRAGALQLLYRASAGHNPGGHVLEESNFSRRILGTAVGYRHFHQPVCVGEAGTERTLQSGLLSQREGHGGEHVPRSLVLRRLRFRHLYRKHDDQAEIARRTFRTGLWTDADTE